MSRVVASGGSAESHEARLRLICACAGYQAVRVKSSLRAMGKIRRRGRGIGAPRRASSMSDRRGRERLPGCM